MSKGGQGEGAPGRRVVAFGKWTSRGGPEEDEDAGEPRW